MSLQLEISPAIYREQKEAKNSDFVVYYKDVPIGFVDSVIEAAERYYSEITRDMGFTRYNGWTFDERAKIYIYMDKDDYVDSARQSGWSHGSDQTRQKIIRTFPAAHGFFDSILPHELGHIIFREFVGFYIDIPLWFEEGIAMFQEK